MRTLLLPQVRKHAGARVKEVLNALIGLGRFELLALLERPGALRRRVNDEMLVMDMGRHTAQPTRKKKPPPPNDDELLRAFRETQRASCANLSHRHKKTRVAPADSKAPLHGPHVGRMHKFVVARLDDTVAKALGYTSDAELLRAVITGKDVYANCPSSVQYSDVLHMLARRYIRRVQPHEIVRTGFVFTVLELKETEKGELQERRRWLLWPRQLNEELRMNGYKADMNMVDLQQHLADAHEGTHALVFDLKLGFNQLGLDEGVAPFHGFCVLNDDGELEHYVSDVMVMGGRPSPEVLQKVVESVSREALRRAAPKGKVVWRVQIDGVRYVGDAADLELVRTHFMELCKEANITVKAEGALNTPHSEGDWMGLHFCYSPKTTVQLTPKALKKIEDAQRTLHASPTVEDVMSIFGVATYYGAAMRAPSHEFYAAIKYCRRLSSSLARGAVDMLQTAPIWESARPAFDAWFAFLRANVPVVPVRVMVNVDACLFTDASTKGWGAVLCVDGIVLHTGRAWETPGGEINALEAQAVQLAAEHFAEYLAGHDVLVVVDNTSTLHGLRRGSAHSGRLNSAVGAALRALGLAQPKGVTVAYISTAVNPADAPSRDRVFRWSALSEDIRRFYATRPASRSTRTLAVGCTGDGVKSGGSAASREVRCSSPSASGMSPL